MALFPTRPYSSVTKPVNRHWNTIWIKHCPDSSRNTLSWFYPLPSSTIHCLLVQDKWDPIQQPFGQPCRVDTTTGVVTAAVHGTTEELDPMLHDTCAPQLDTLWQHVAADGVHSRKRTSRARRCVDFVTPWCLCFQMRGKVLAMRLQVSQVSSSKPSQVRFKLRMHQRDWMAPDIWRRLIYHDLSNNSPFLAVSFWNVYVIGTYVHFPTSPRVLYTW